MPARISGPSRCSCLATAYHFSIPSSVQEPVEFPLYESRSSKFLAFQHKLDKMLTRKVL